MESHAVSAINSLREQTDIEEWAKLLHLNPVHCAIPPIEFPSLKPMVVGVPSKTVEQIAPSIALDLLLARVRLLATWKHPGHIRRARKVQSELTRSSEATNPKILEARNLLVHYLENMKDCFPQLVDADWLK